MPTPAKLAVLIDADNASSAAINSLLDEVATYDSASVKRIYRAEGSFIPNRRSNASICFCAGRSTVERIRFSE